MLKWFPSPGQTSLFDYPAGGVSVRVCADCGNTCHSEAEGYFDDEESENDEDFSEDETCGVGSTAAAKNISRIRNVSMIQQSIVGLLCVVLPPELTRM